MYMWIYIYIYIFIDFLYFKKLQACTKNANSVVIYDGCILKYFNVYSNSKLKHYLFVIITRPH